MLASLQNISKLGRKIESSKFLDVIDDVYNFQQGFCLSLVAKIYVRALGIVEEIGIANGLA